MSLAREVIQRAMKYATEEGAPAGHIARVDPLHSNPFTNTAIEIPGLDDMLGRSPARFDPARHHPYSRLEL